MASGAWTASGTREYSTCSNFYLWPPGRLSGDGYTLALRIQAFKLYGAGEGRMVNKYKDNGIK